MECCSEMIKHNRLLMAAVIWTLLVGGSFSQTERRLTTIDVAVLSPSGEEFVDLD